MALSANTGVTLPGVSSPATLFDSNQDGGAGLQKCCTFSVTNRSTSAEYAFVNVAGLHPPGYWAPIAPGEPVLFRYGSAIVSETGIALVTGYSVSGTAVVDTKIVSKF